MLDALFVYAKIPGKMLMQIHIWVKGAKYGEFPRGRRFRELHNTA